MNNNKNAPSTSAAPTDSSLVKLPFKGRQQAEAKSFVEGYRGAWFRCKIKNSSKRKGQLGHFLEFYDFPDEEVTWSQLYQKPPHHTEAVDELELMMRPPFPPFYRESSPPDPYPESDVIAVVKDDWQVGDLVDWWCANCFWSGRISKLLGNDKVQIVLPDPPIGEGRAYEAFLKDLRPSLNWAPKAGWTVPISRVDGDSPYCARLIHQIGEDTSDSDSGSLDVQEEVAIMQLKHMPPIKRADTVEAAIMNLEELALKLRWLKDQLKSGHQSSSMTSSWIVETHKNSG